MAEIKITQVRSANGSNGKQRDALRTLRLGRIGRTAVHEESPSLDGLIRVVGHLVEIEGGS